jgi:hypothetical protein
MKKFALAALALGIATSAQAHEIWVERDGSGPARIYLGEPAEALPPGGDPEFEKLKAPHVLSAPSAAQTRKAGYIEVAAPAGDVRVWDDNVFTPWGEAGKKESVAYYARAGRTDTKAALPFEIVPATPEGNRFTLVRDGKPVPATAVTVISPDKWTKSVTTDASGAITVPSRGAGRYLLTASIKDEGSHQTPGGPVAVLHRITTTSFVAR